MEENLRQINARCPFCGTDLTVDKGEVKITCSSCNKEMPATMAIKYYESLVGTPAEAKEAHGEDYQRLNYILDEIYGLIDIQEWKKAEEKFEEALTLSDTDYKVYMAMVAIKTKNYTDLKDEEHTEYINKAIACADADSKKEIVNCSFGVPKGAKISILIGKSLRLLYIIGPTISQVKPPVFAMEYSFRPRSWAASASLVKYSPGPSNIRV